MIAHRSPEPPGESAAMKSLVRHVIILIAADLGGYLAAASSAALEVLAQDLKLHEEQDADAHLQGVHRYDGRHADGDGACLYEEADSVPRVRAGVEGIPSPDRECSVLHGREEQQGDHEGESQSAERARAHSAEEQVLVQDLVFAASCKDLSF